MRLIAGVLRKVLREYRILVISERVMISDFWWLVSQLTVFSRVSVNVTKKKKEETWETSDDDEATVE